jgi:hypothetical protein
MTSQTKKFIEIPDIIAFRFECADCHTCATIPTDNFQKMPRACVNCGAEWAIPHSPSVQETFQHLGEAMRSAQRCAESRKIVFSLELKEEPKPSVSQT